MKRENNNYAYIDGANLHRGIAGFGWKLDYARFRVWLSEQYGVIHAYIFIGLIPKKCSILLKRTDAPITYLSDMKEKISLKSKEKAPIKHEP